ncbi:MAG: ThuA domain-containing protein [Pirellulales bacterium]
MIASRTSLVIVLAAAILTSAGRAEDLSLRLRYQVETSNDSGRFHRLMRAEKWENEQTAIVVCDVWDLHHCLNAVRRVEEFAPRLNKVLAAARDRGVTIIHSPSDCMNAYADHPARKRALAAPKAPTLPKDIRSWCSRIPGEERAVYPIDQSDGGEDDDPAEHTKWVAKLKSLGRNPGMPWKKQSDLITIDPQGDFISDRGDEVWNVLEARGIVNVILTGVHTNMCVLGRPFGLRQMAHNGKHVVLMRDMTDTMYNPQRWPYVSHFTGTDLIIAHVEQFVCPTITSDQLIGGEPFRFKNDKRPHLAIIMAEDEYETNHTLPKFALGHLGPHFRVSYVFGSDKQRHAIPGITVLDDADVALLSIRRRALPPHQMAAVQRFIKSGKPVAGIRTASHAFSLGGKKVPPDGLVTWKDFDGQVFGGNYTGHHGNKLKSVPHNSAAAKGHPILHGTESLPPTFQGGSLYKTSPLVKGTKKLVSGVIEGHPEEPISWTFRRTDGGNSFYTSMGHPADFQNFLFLRRLTNALHWLVGGDVEKLSDIRNRPPYTLHWTTMKVPAAWESAAGGALKNYDGVAWYRCSVRLPQAWISRRSLSLAIEPKDDKLQVWINGEKLRQSKGRFAIRPETIAPDDANLIVVRVEDRGGEGGLRVAPVVTSGDKQLELKGRWQFIIGDDDSRSNMPLPAKFGASTDIFFEP